MWDIEKWRERLEKCEAVKPNYKKEAKLEEKKGMGF